MSGVNSVKKMQKKHRLVLFAFAVVCSGCTSYNTPAKKSNIMIKSTAGNRRTGKDKESDVEILLDHDGRIPGGMLPNFPKPPLLNYGFRSFHSFLNFSSHQVVCIIIQDDIRN